MGPRSLNNLQSAKESSSHDSCLLQEGKASLYSYVAKIEDVEPKFVKFMKNIV